MEPGTHTLPVRVIQGRLRMDVTHVQAPMEGLETGHWRQMEEMELEGNKEGPLQTGMEEVKRRSTEEAVKTIERVQVKTTGILEVKTTEILGLTTTEIMEVVRVMVVQEMEETRVAEEVEVKIGLEQVVEARTMVGAPKRALEEEISRKRVWDNVQEMSYKPASMSAPV